MEWTSLGKVESSPEVKGEPDDEAATARKDRHPHERTRPLARQRVRGKQLWRSVKYEEMYLDTYASVPDGRARITWHLASSNAIGPHPAHGGRVPDPLYFAQPLLAAAWSTSGSPRIHAASHFKQAD